MAYSREPEVIQPTLFCGSYEYEAGPSPTNGDHLPSDGTFYGCPLLNVSGYHQEELLRALIPSSCREEEPAFASNPWNEAVETEAAYEGEQQPYYGYGNWLSQYNSVFNGCWEDNYGSVGNAIHNDENGNDLEKTDSSNPTYQEQCDTRFTRQDEDEENYYTWSCCDTWLEYGGEKGFSNYCGEETTDLTYSRGLSEIGVCEGLFGYWPCLYRRN
ncbi:hypothetical protein PanWU01x14_062710 [Parasponia andersonii]|uniref:Uncharacterized protein n=1 Tax=Parasponia andersonii TaxID=3476 RepID=A0A2P5DHL6_PARAD|nr:hypothetical protein PanWU01x14_062710 [Parasponia andersonii]